MMIKLVSFDLDGTIADTLELGIRTFKMTVEPYLGRELSEKEILGYYGLSIDGMLREVVGDDISDVIACQKASVKCLSAAYATTKSNIERLEVENPKNIFYTVESLIEGVTLTPEQQASIKIGEATFIEGMTSKGGKKFDAYVQINAEKRGMEFRFGDTQRQTQSQSQSNDQPKEVRIPKRPGGKDVTPEDQQKLKEGGTIYMERLKDKEGKIYNAYVKVNNEKNKLDFYRYNPNKAKSQGAEITPDNASHHI